MTCTHVLGLIDAGPFADYPPAHLDAAWQHARQCAACGSALEAATALTAALAALPQPAAPPDLAATVLARMAEVDRARSASRAATADTMTRAAARDWFWWAAASGSVAAGLAIFLSMAPGTESPINAAFPIDRGMRAGLRVTPSTPREALVLVTGLTLYLVGLFAPLHGRPGGKKGTGTFFAGL